MKDVFVARQAIYDRKSQVFAYELLYRAGLDNRAEFPDALSATTEVLLNSFMEIGLDNLAGGKRVFVNLPQGFFTELPPIPFDNDRIVLELLEDLEVNDQLCQAVAKLKSEGFTIAIDDYLFESKWEPLLQFIDIIKVEIPGLTEEQLRQRIGGLKQKGLTLLAEKIETLEVYELCRELGFDLFQGFFFSRPNIVQGRKLDDNQMVVLRLLERLNDPEASMDDVERLISQDAALSFKVLRHANSASMGLSRKVDSIRRAIVLMGLQKIRVWASLMAMSGIKGKSTEVIVLALIRARMCEAMARESGYLNPDSAFTIGLFSMLDVLLDQPLEEILAKLPLANEGKEAILEHKGSGGALLECTIGHEHHDWQKMSLTGIEDQRLQELYWDVVGQVWHSGLV
ncbi:MAG: HDOD domain-containing protein [Gammaproteobacteria bacterium]|nr:HDOD domain-containing protein [Gammaproteobacteria bacterium]